MLQSGIEYAVMHTLQKLAQEIIKLLSPPPISNHFITSRSFRAMELMSFRFASYLFCRSPCHLRHRTETVAGE